MKTVGRVGIVMMAATVPLLGGCADKHLTIDLGSGVTMKLARIEAGTFLMGSKHPSKNEGPQYEMTIGKPFYMGATEVTQAQWQAVMNTQPWQGNGRARRQDDHAAASDISWHDATAFCTALSAKTGRTVRLPTEAEWEYACRAGATTVYSFGDDRSRLGYYAWYMDNAWHKGRGHAHPVGVKKPNAWGLYDMHGNVYEWCANAEGDSYVVVAEAHDLTDRASPRVRRGGSWFSFPKDCTAAHHRADWPELRHAESGFRVVVEVK